MRITVRETRQIAILEKALRREIKQVTAAESLGCSERTIRRRLKRYKKNGVAGLVHRLQERPGNRAADQKLRKKVLNLMRTTYAGWPPTHAAQKLAEVNKLVVIAKTLRTWMMQEGLWTKQRKRRAGRRWRERKECFGQMVQLDGSRHKWVPDQWWTLLKFVDDATGRVFMRFYDAESYDNVADLTIRYLKAFGKPTSIYTDRGGVYKVTVNNDEGDLITRYGKVLRELGVELIHANSPQAKGRVERSFNTDQQRLVRELVLAGITSRDAANDYLETVYIPQHNTRYARNPRNPIDIHQRVGETDFNYVFATLCQRTVRNDWTIQYEHKQLQLDNSRPAIVKPKDLVTVRQLLDGRLIVSIRSQVIEFKEIIARPIKQLPEPLVKPAVYHKPVADHPWRKYRACV